MCFDKPGVPEELVKHVKDLLSTWRSKYSATTESVSSGGSSQANDINAARNYSTASEVSTVHLKWKIGGCAEHARVLLFYPL